MALLPQASFGKADPCGPSCISGRLGTVWNERIDGLTAYDQTYSNGHPERLRTDEAVGFYVDFSYSDLVDARVGVIPKYNATSDSKEDANKTKLNYAKEEDTIVLIVSALVKPIDGVQVSASYAVNPSSTADSWAVGDDIDHGWAMAANVNITDIIGIDEFMSMDVEEEMSRNDLYLFQELVNKRIIHRKSMLVIGQCDPYKLDSFVKPKNAAQSIKGRLLGKATVISMSRPDLRLYDASNEDCLGT